jgi:hypothetical protein
MIIGIKNTIPTSNNLAPEWLPSDESTLVAWYKNGTGITEDVGVASWADSSSNSYDMVQATDAEQPAYSAGTLTFDTTASQTLVSSSFIGGTDGLDAEFIIGIKLNPTDSSAQVILGATTPTSEMLKIMDTDTIRVKPATTNVDFDLEAGHATSDDSVWIIVRKNNDEASVYKDLNGVLVQQDSAKACAGKYKIDTIGRKAGGSPNYFDGTMKEIVIFKDVDDADSDALRDNLYARLKSL